MNTCEKIEKDIDITLKIYGSPMEVGDHPETDESDLLPPDEITKYQMLVGCAQWDVSIGRYDIQYATNQWLSTLAAHEQRAAEMIVQLEEMVRKYVGNYP